MFHSLQKAARIGAALQHFSFFFPGSLRHVRWKPQSSSCLRSKGNNLWIADTIIFFEGTWDVGMGCSARGEGRQAGQTLEGSKGSLLVVSPPTATRNDGFFGVCTIFCSSRSVHALLNSNRRFLSRNIRQEIIIFFRKCSQALQRC